MVKHIVIYQLREDCDKQAAVQEISQALEPWLASFLASSGWRSAPPPGGCGLCPVLRV